MDQQISIQKEQILTDHSESHTELAKELNRVIAKSINSSKEFLLFAGKADSTTLFDLCMSLKHRRDDFTLQLQKEVTAIGQEPATEQNFAGWFHKGWARIRFAVEKENDYVIAAEGIREEESMRLALSDALKSQFLSESLRRALSAEMGYSENLRNTMEDIKVKLKPDDYVDVHGS